MWTRAFIEEVSTVNLVFRFSRFIFWSSRECRCKREWQQSRASSFFVREKRLFERAKNGVLAEVAFTQRNFFRRFSLFIQNYVRKGRKNCNFRVSRKRNFVCIEKNDQKNTQRENATSDKSPFFRVFTRTFLANERWRCVRLSRLHRDTRDDQKTKRENRKFSGNFLIILFPLTRHPQRFLFTSQLMKSKFWNKQILIVAWFIL